MKQKILLVLIILLAFVLRFYKLSSYPALNADEAAIGYNAYSLIQTGRDEHGNPWPVHFQSFNDYKPGLYFYMVLPFVKVIGLNEWAVRIPGAALGVMTVLVIYLLAKELFPEIKFIIYNLPGRHAGLQFTIGEIAALLLAISPWHIHFSRGGWEVNVSTFFITTGIWLFFKSIKNPKFLVMSLLSFVASLYTYHAARVVVPLFGIGLVAFYKRELIKSSKWLLIAAIAAIIILIPLIKDLTGLAGISRAAGVGLFADSGPLSRINEQRGEHGDYLSLSAKLLHNKAVNYGLAFLSNWSKHYWGEFLFLSGDEIQRNKVPETGELYLYQLPLLIIGLWYIFKNVIPRNWKFILLWLVAAPVASALTFQSPHALRAHNMVIPLTLISAYGMAMIIKWLNGSKFLRVLGFGVIGVLVFWSFALYEHMYWLHMSKEYPYSSQYGVKELVNFASANQSNYKKIIVTNRYDQPYILFLFYMKYSPEKFQKEHQLTPKDKYGFSTVTAFDKYIFEPVNFDSIKPDNPNSLIAGTNEEIPKEANIINKIYGSNGFLYFKVVAN
ncbi:hypothetical protein A3A50_02260 [Candidatus Woesebacteria bacterium RIFCSPLOWO2_01_FULL_38_20]|nr:MAG: hypothetical protein A3A50_02260 [Candidatus Woesebacteria bacterium RIFCSPLOWO2_01_FULL_38_20]